MDRRQTGSAFLLLVLWFALTVSIGVYAALAELVATPSEALAAVEFSADAGLGLALTSLGVVSGLLALFVFFRLRKGAKSSSARLRWALVAYALSETMALSGWILAVLHRQPDLAYPFCGGAILLNLVMFPGLPKNQE